MIWRQLPSWLINALRIIWTGGILVPLTFVAFMLIVDPYSDVADKDYDEGLNIMKAMMLEQGFRLYADIWSDQPPVFTQLLHGWFDRAGASVASARFLVTLLSAALLWTFFLLVQQTASILAALLSVLLLVISPYYIRLSGSVMIGLPALAFITASIALLVVLAPQKWMILKYIVAGIVAGIAVQTKYFVVVAVLAILVYLLFVEKTRAGARLCKPGRLQWLALLWYALGALLGIIGIAVAFQAADSRMLLSTHYGAASSTVPLRESMRFVWDYVRQNIIYYIIAGIGLFHAVRRRDASALLPAVWLISAMVALGWQRPVRYHYVLLMSIPLCWLCGYGIQGWIVWLRSRLGEHVAGGGRRFFSLAAPAIVGVIALLAVVYYPSSLWQRLEAQSTIYRPLYDWNLMQKLTELAREHPGYVFTDRSYYAFQAGQPVPPGIVVLSNKRLQAEPDDAFMMEALTQFEPRYVLLERYLGQYSVQVMEYVEQHYELVQDSGTGQLYVRRA